MVLSYWTCFDESKKAAIKEEAWVVLGDLRRLFKECVN
jgi:hypothetical protein